MEFDQPQWGYNGNDTTCISIMVIESAHTVVLMGFNVLTFYRMPKRNGGFLFGYNGV